MLVNLKIICQFHAHSVNQTSVEIYRGRLFCRAEIYRWWLLTLITRGSSRLLCIRFSADLAMYWFPACHFRCKKFKPLVIWIWNQNIAISTIVGTSSHININVRNFNFPIGSYSNLGLSTLSIVGGYFKKVGGERRAKQGWKM
jgi:hypothetical protein